MSEFKVGDFVVEVNGHSGLLEVIELVDGAVIVKYSRLTFTNDKLRHATPEEIKARRCLP